MNFYQIGWFLFDFFQSLHNVDIDLKPPFLIKSGYYIVPSPSTVLV